MDSRTIDNFDARLSSRATEAVCTAIVLALAISAAVGCGGEDGDEQATAQSTDDGSASNGTTSSGSGGPASGGEPSSSGEGDSSGDDPSTSDGGDTGTSGGDTDPSEDTSEPGESMLEVIEAFDPALGQLPEGLALRGSDAFVAFAPTGQVYRIDTTGAAAPEPFAAVPPLPENMAFITGLAFDDQDRLLIALPSFVDEPPTGIYRAAADGGDATLFSTHPMMLFPSAIRRHPQGDLFVTDSFSAAIFRVAADGQATLWVTDPLLAGDKTICGNDDSLFDIGANGLIVAEDRLIVAVSDQAQLVEIPIEEDGTAGPIEVIAGPDCSTLEGLDGLDLGEDGWIYATLNHRNEVVRVDETGTLEVLVSDPVLDFPATPRLGTADGQPALYFTNFALPTALAGGQAQPSLARLWPVPR